MLNRRMSLLPAAVLASLTFAAACSSGHTDSTQSTEDDLSTWQSILVARPAWATASRQRETLGDGEQLTVQIHLKLRNEDQADAEIAAISDPDSATFGQYLTNDQFAAKYAPTASDMKVVTDHLARHGLTVTGAADSNLFVTATGSHAQIQSAFATKLANYEVNGDTRHAPLAIPRVPRSVAAKINGTLGLSTSPAYKPRNVALGGISRNKVPQLLSKNPAAASSALPTCAEWWGQAVDSTDPQFGTYPAAPPIVPCGYSPGQLRAAYGFTDAVRSGNDGKGVKVAIVDAYLSPTLLQDAQTYAAQHDPDYPLLASQFSTQMAPGQPSTPDPGWYGEQSLDVEAVHAIAPGATIVYMGAQSASDVDLVSALNVIIERDLATLISNSYGSAEGQANDFVIWNAISKHAALKGIGVNFASGDNGDESANLGFPSADFPASLPGVTAVGGTSLALGQTNERVFESGWATTASFLTLPSAATDAGAGGDAGPAPAPVPFWDPPAPGFFAFGAGGGTSLVYDQPAYQKGVVPDSLANQPGAPARVVPDVAMLADPDTGFLLGLTTDGVYGEGPTGGTSLACPLFTASLALAQQKSGKTLGFANPRLYKMHAKGLRDIAPLATPQAAIIPSSQGNIVVTFDYAGQAIQTAVGYDNITGLGAPDGDNFLKAVK